jgi:hypothetical protein
VLIEREEDVPKFISKSVRKLCGSSPSPPSKHEENYNGEIKEKII